MSRKESLSLDEFATAPRRVKPAEAGTTEPDAGEVGRELPPLPVETADRDRLESAQVDPTEARRALRRLKRERLKGVESFVNVRLDRETKKRLKFASFSTDDSMQLIMVQAIRKYLDDNGW